MHDISQSLDRIASALERIASSLENRNQSVLSPLTPEALSKEDAARFLGVDVGSIDHLIRTRKLGFVQHGSQRGRVISVESLRKFLREYQQATSNELLKKRGNA